MSGLILFIMVFRHLVTGRLNERNSLFWLAGALVSLGLGAFPELVDPIADLAGIDYAPSLLFLLSTVALLGMMLQHSVELSLLRAQLREVSQQLAIMRHHQAEQFKPTGQDERGSRISTDAKGLSR